MKNECPIITVVLYEILQKLRSYYIIHLSLFNNPLLELGLVGQGLLLSKPYA